MNYIIKNFFAGLLLTAFILLAWFSASGLDKKPCKKFDYVIYNPEKGAIVKNRYEITNEEDPEWDYGRYIYSMEYSSKKTNRWYLITDEFHSVGDTLKF